MTRRQSKAARAAARARADKRAPLPAHAIARLGEVADRAIAAELGVPTRHVAAERQARGIAPIRAGRKLRAGARATVGRTVWLTPAEAAAHDAAAARAGLAWSPWMVGLANANAAAAGAKAMPPGLAEELASLPDADRRVAERVAALPEIEPAPGYDARAVERARREGVLP